MNPLPFVFIFWTVFGAITGMMIAVIFTEGWEESETATVYWDSEITCYLSSGGGVDCYNSHTGEKTCTYHKSYREIPPGCWP